MSNRSRTAQREVGHTAPTWRGCEIMDRKNSTRRRRSSPNPARLLVRITSLYLPATQRRTSLLYATGPLRVRNSTLSVTVVQVGADQDRSHEGTRDRHVRPFALRCSPGE